MIIVIEFMFLGINIFWALLRAHFNPRLTARAKMSLSRAQNIFMPANINSILLFYHWYQWIIGIDESYSFVYIVGAGPEVYTLSLVGKTF